MISKFKKNSKGFSLVEVLIAVVIMAVVALPLLQVFTLSADLTRKSRSKGEATAAAQNILETIEARGVDVFRAATPSGKMQDTISLSMLGDSPISQMNTSAEEDFVSIKGVSVGSKTFDAVVNFDRNGEESNIGGVNRSIGLTINDKPIAQYTQMNGDKNMYSQPFTESQNPDVLAEQQFKNDHPGVTTIPKRTRTTNITVTSAPDGVNGGYNVDVLIEFVYKYTGYLASPVKISSNKGDHIDSYDDEFSLFFLYYAFYESTATENINIYVDRDNEASDLKFKAFIVKMVPMVKGTNDIYVNALSTDAGSAGTDVLNKDRAYKLTVSEYHNNKLSLDLDSNGNPTPEMMNVYTNANKQLSNRNLDCGNFSYRIKKTHASGYFTFGADSIARNQLVRTDPENRYFGITINIYESGALDGEDPVPVYTLPVKKLK